MYLRHNKVKHLVTINWSSLFSNPPQQYRLISPRRPILASGHIFNPLKTSTRSSPVCHICGLLEPFCGRKTVAETDSQFIFHGLRAAIFVSIIKPIRPSMLIFVKPSARLLATFSLRHQWHLNNEALLGGSLVTLKMLVAILSSDGKCPIIICTKIAKFHRQSTNWKFNNSATAKEIHVID